MFSTDFIFRQQKNLVDNQKCQAGFRPLCNKILLLCISANKILVTTGVSDDSEETEVWNLETESVCENDLPDYPMKLSYATGGLIGGKPVVCGGLDDDFERSEQCYVLENNRWTFLAEMISKRSSSSSVVTPDGNSLFITGGNLICITLGCQINE